MDVSLYCPLVFSQKVRFAFITSFLTLFAYALMLHIWFLFSIFLPHARGILILAHACKVLTNSSPWKSTWSYPSRHRKGTTRATTCQRTCQLQIQLLRALWTHLDIRLGPPDTSLVEILSVVCHSPGIV